MTAPTTLLLLADLLLLVHVLFVAFVILGLLLVWVGRFLGWRWIVNAWFRIGHLLAIVIVVVQSWLGVACPLTVWEMDFRASAGDAVYAGTFMSHWMHTILYYQAPEWVFVLAYSLFFVLVVASLIWIRPSFRSSR